MATRKKSGEGDTKAAKKKTTRKTRKKAEAKSRGLAAVELDQRPKSPEVVACIEGIEAAGGRVLASFLDPLGSHWQILAALPIERVAPTPFQRDLSDTHVKRLAGVIDRLDWYIDPIVAVPAAPGAEFAYWTPNGFHRLEGMKLLGARSIVALVLPDREVAYQILALNTEKAHNVKEKALEVIRMARFLAELDGGGGDGLGEQDFAFQFEEPALLTLGVCYEQRGRFAGGAYNSILKRVETFLEGSLREALEMRSARAARLLAIDDQVSEAVKKLKDRGFDSPYLKAFVIARVNPLRFKKGPVEGEGVVEATFDKIEASLAKLDLSAVRADQVAKASGPAEE